MGCPACTSPLADEPDCRSCPSCGGVFFTAEQAWRYFGLLTTETAPEEDLRLPPAPSTRSCPTCALPLEHLDVGETLGLDHCPRCRGIFFDAGESLRLKGLLASGHEGPTLRARVLQILGRPGSGPYR